jgi:hypothetical protein
MNTWRETIVDFAHAYGSHLVQRSRWNEDRSTEAQTQKRAGSWSRWLTCCAGLRFDSIPWPNELYPDDLPHSSPAEIRMHLALADRQDGFLRVAISAYLCISALILPTTQGTDARSDGIMQRRTSKWIRRRTLSIVKVLRCTGMISKLEVRRVDVIIIVEETTNAPTHLRISLIQIWSRSRSNCC